MIAPSFSLTATERVLPKLALDFTTASLDSRITFTRTTDATHPATYVNSSGVVSAATNNQPRFDYDPVTLACKGLLIEESRANTVVNSVLAGSGGINPTSWTRLLGTVGSQAVSTIADSGVANAWTFTATSDRQIIYQTVSVAANTTYYASIYVESNVSALPYQRLFAIANAPAGATVSYVATTTTAGSRLTAQIVVGATAGSVQFRFGVGVDTNATGTVRFSCPQLEAGAFATSYIPTTTTALTRDADVAVMTGTNFSDWFNASEGTFAYTWQSNGQTNGSQRFGMTISDGTANNRIRSFVNSSTTQVTTQVTSAGTSVASLNNTVTATTGTVNKTCAAYKLDSFASSSNASSPTTDTSGAVPTGINQSIIGADIGSTGFLNGVMQKISYWPQRLTNAEVQAFSK